MTDLQRSLIWESTKTHPTLDQRLWRIDPAGRLIHLNSFGKRHSAYGWDVRYTVALTDGGTDHSSNLQAVHCKTSLQRATA
jgi:hypothetical protein